MPEGDVVRRTAARLDLALAGRPLVRADLRWPTAAQVDLVGRTVLTNAPYGKHLLTRFDDGRTLHTHLRMEGAWRLARTGSPGARAAGSSVRAVLATATWTAVGDRLGMLEVLATSEEQRVLGHLGPDLLADDFEPSGAAVAHARWRAVGTRPVCETVLDQRVVAGIGTIFMAESLFVLRIWPWTPADRVDPARVLGVARTLMQRSVAAAPPSRAAFEPAVPGRARRPCRRCGTPIAVGSARSSTPGQERPVFYCPACQHA